jgi:hypothetical protein
MPIITCFLSSHRVALLFLKAMERRRYRPAKLGLGLQRASPDALSSAERA